MLVGLFFVTTTSVKNASLSSLSCEKTGNKSPCGNMIVPIDSPKVAVVELTKPSSSKFDGKK